LLGVALSLPVALRRRYPLAALSAGATAATLAALAAPLISGPLLFLPVAYVLYLVAAVSRRKVAIGALAAVLALVGIEGLIDYLRPSGRPVSTSLPVALVVIMTWMLGY